MASTLIAAAERLSQAKAASDRASLAVRDVNDALEAAKQADMRASQGLNDALRGLSDAAMSEASIA